MKDTYQRNINYLRLSITDKCNLRCRYCMPAEGVHSLPHAAILTQEEMVMATRACASLGVNKVRVTGGEPLVKRNIVPLCEAISSIEGIQSVSLTTNGTLLPPLAASLRKAGVKRVNISLDTLDGEKYRRITRIGSLSEALAGIESALATGFEKVKLNAVLMGGFNDDEIRPLAELTRRWPVDVRFIELMPMAEDDFFTPASFLGNAKVLECLPELESVPEDGGVARLYHLPGAQGNIGLISPLSNLFCSSCNRIRITADGKVKPCLHSHVEFSIKGLDYESMKKVLEDAILSKPEKHSALSYEERSDAGRNMNAIGG